MSKEQRFTHDWREGVDRVPVEVGEGRFVYHIYGSVVAVGYKKT